MVTRPKRIKSPGASGLVLVLREELAFFEVEHADGGAARADPVLFRLDRSIDRVAALGADELGLHPPKPVHLPAVLALLARLALFVEFLHVLLGEWIPDPLRFLLAEQLSAVEKERFVARVTEAPPRVRNVDRLPAVWAEKLDVPLGDFVHTRPDSAGNRRFCVFRAGLDPEKIRVRGLADGGAGLWRKFRFHGEN